MVEAAPAAALVVPEPDFLLEILVVPLDPPAQLSQVDHLLEADLLGQGRQPVLRRLRLALGPLDQQPFLEASSPFVPSRQAISVQAVSGRASATALTGTGWCCASRRSRVARRPRPDQDLGGSGPVPGGHTVVLDRTAAT